MDTGNGKHGDSRTGNKKIDMISPFIRHPEKEMDTGWQEKRRINKTATITTKVENMIPDRFTNTIPIRLVPGHF